MRRFSLNALFAGTAILGAIACNDSGLGPDSARRAASAATADEFRGAGRSFEFDISPKGGNVDIGNAFILNVPANAVCDLSSSYGPAAWNAECKPAGETIHVRTRVWVKRGRLYVDFKPSLRFSPSAEVTISTNRLAATLAGRSDLANHGSLRRFGILYSPGPDQGSIDEAKLLGDASLITRVDLRTGRVWRRIKHFSGYNVALGIECELSELDPDCIDVEVIPGR